MCVWFWAAVGSWLDRWGEGTGVPIKEAGECIYHPGSIYVRECPSSAVKRSAIHSMKFPKFTECRWGPYITATSYAILDAINITAIALEVATTGKEKFFILTVVRCLNKTISWSLFGFYNVYLIASLTGETITYSWLNAWGVRRHRSLWCSSCVNQPACGT